ncbi:MAG: MFS transporter [Bacteroidales bacterium]|nr:MFS transporter [Bacteroidales bacterium]
MTEIIKNTLRESAFARWMAIFFMSFAMLFAYIFIDALAPFRILLERDFGWTPDIFGTVAGSAYFLNVIGFMLVAGIILDKMGVRRTAILSALLMMFGAFIKSYGVSYTFINGGFGYEFFSSFLPRIPASAKVAIVGFAIFGAGLEMAGITVPKAIVKWFKGKEMALAMGMNLAIARLGAGLVFFVLPEFALLYGFSTTITLSALSLCIVVLSFGAYFLMDLKLERQDRESDVPEDLFKFSDLKQIFASKAFMIISGLCVLYYVAIFPFQKFALGMLESGLVDSPIAANRIFMFFPVGAMILTPFLGWFLDSKGKGATMLIWGAGLMVVCHSFFAIFPNFSFPLALSAIVLLGISFSLVPAALWPAVPRLVEDKVLGSAYGVIFWIQNIGLFFVPILIGFVLRATNVGIDIAAGDSYSYTWMMVIFASFGMLAMLLGFWLKAEDKKKGYGMELPNKVK